MSSIRTHLILAVSLTAFGLSGCSFSVDTGSNSVSTSDAAATIKRQYLKQTGVELPELECDSADAEVGTGISCRGTNAADVELEIDGEVIEVSSDSEKVDFKWTLTRAYSPAAHYETAAAEALRKQLDVPVESVDCPDRILVKPGNQVRCEATVDDGLTTDIMLELTDGDGGFTVSLADPPDA